MCVCMYVCVKVCFIWHTRHTATHTCVLGWRHRTHTRMPKEVAVLCIFPSWTVRPPGQPGAVGSLYGARGPSQVIGASWSVTDRRVVCSSACFAVGVLSGGTCKLHTVNTGRKCKLHTERPGR